MLNGTKLLPLLGVVLLWTALTSAQLNVLKESRENEQKFDSDKEVMLNVRKQYGAEGERVRYDEHDRPYILCNKYNPTECNPAKNSTCPRQERCYPENQSARLSCMAVFTNSSQGLQVSVKGCWTHDEYQLRDCDERQCLANAKSGGGDGSAMMFCCCRTHNCNARVGIAPEEPVLESKTNVTMSVPEPSAPFMTILYVLMPICLGAMLICFGYWFYRTRNDKRSKSNAMIPLVSPSEVAVEGKRQSVQHRNIQLLEVTARGRFGQVHRAMMGSQTVAVKIFPASDVDSWVQEQEIYGLSALKGHPNILHFICAEAHDTDRGPTNAQYWLVTEFQEQGSLSDYLKTNTASTTQALRIVTTMMNGLAFLHEESKPGLDGDIYKPTIVHRDFKSRNVLLKKGQVACIADFGLAMRCENGRTPADDHGQVGTRRYMSPEVLEGATEFSALAFRAIDIYAAALVIWEVLSRTRVKPDESIPDYRLPYELEVGAHPSLGEMRDLIAVRKLRPITRAAIRTHEVGAVMCKAMEEMWEMEPDGRITAGCCLERMIALGKTTGATRDSLNNCLNQTLQESTESRNDPESSPLIQDCAGPLSAPALRV